MIRHLKLFFATAAIAAALSPSNPSAAEYGVYEYVVKNTGGTIEEIAAAIATAAAGSGWQVSAVVESGAPEGCRMESRVLVLFVAEYAGKVMAVNPETGPYAVLDRVNVFTDENGTNVAVANPNSINRTILMDDSSFSGAWG